MRATPSPGLGDNGAMRLLAACATILLAALTASAQDRFPEGPGKAALVKVCMGCHPAEVAASKRHTHEEWEHTVVDMVNAGATGTDDEFGAIVEYLATYFPKKVEVNKAPAVVIASALSVTPK